MCTCMQVRNRMCAVCVTERSVSRRTSSHTVANILDTCRFRAISAAPQSHTRRHARSASKLKPTYDATSSPFTVLEPLLHGVFAPHRPKSPDRAMFCCLHFLWTYSKFWRPGAVCLVQLHHCTIRLLMLAELNWRYIVTTSVNCLEVSECFESRLKFASRSVWSPICMTDHCVLSVIQHKTTGRRRVRKPLSAFKAAPTIVGRPYVLLLNFLPSILVRPRRSRGAPSKVHQWLGRRCPTKNWLRHFTHPSPNYYRGH